MGKSGRAGQWEKCLHRGQITGMHLSASTLFTVSIDGFLVATQAMTGHEKWRMADHAGEISGLHCYGDHVCTVGVDGVIRGTSMVQPSEPRGSQEGIQTAPSTVKASWYIATGGSRSRCGAVHLSAEAVYGSREDGSVVGFNSQTKAR